MKIHRYLLPILLFHGMESTGQVAHRGYTSIHTGYPKYWEIGTTFHGASHFCAGYYYGITRKKTGPVYFPNGGVFSFGRRLRNSYSSISIVAGITTRTFKRLNCSLMAGPSIIAIREYENIEVTAIEYTNADKITYSTVLTQTVGTAIRFDVLGNFNERMGINLSVQGHLNPIENRCYVLIGFCFGVTGERYIPEERWL